jgi:hypothetical protein
VIRPRSYLLKLALAGLLCAAPVNVWATTYTPTTATDFPVTGAGVSINAANGVITGGTGNSQVTLRSAIIAANMSGPGPHTINVPAGLGTYNLSQLNPDSPTTTATGGLNDLQAGSNNSTITIQGTGGTAKIVQTVTSPINDVITTGFRDASYNPAIVTLTLDHLEITGGTFTGIFTGADDGAGHIAHTTITNCNVHDNSNTSSSTISSAGGAIFNQTGFLTISNSTFANNTASNVNGGIGGAIFYDIPNVNTNGNPPTQGSVGTLSVTNCTFTNNKATTPNTFPGGGAIFMSVSTSTGNSATITSCTFSGNQATGGGDGGAIANLGGAPATITTCTFAGNQATTATGHGGAITNQGNLTNPNISFCRFVNNTAVTHTNGDTLFNNNGTVTANDNWWGVNSGPPANAVVGASSFTTNLTRWLQLRNSASPSTVFTNQAPMSTTVTADILGRNSGGPIAGSNLTGLASFPVPAAAIFSNPQRGTLSGTSTQFVDGVAPSITFTAVAPGGIGGVDATADAQIVAATITVDEPPTITSGNSATFKVGLAGTTFTVTATGYPAPTFAVTTGTLPANLTLNATTGVLSGTPAVGTGGVYNLVITASNGVSPNDTQNFTLTVNEAPSITSANNATFTVGSNGTFTVTKTGFPTPTLSESGALPSGVTFDNSSGVLSGTPAAGTGGTYPITFTASNGVDSDAMQNFTLTVNEAPTITSANNVTFTVGTPGTFTVTTGHSFPINPALSETGALPLGVTFTDNHDGTATIAGTPAARSTRSTRTAPSGQTTAADTTGTYPITITAANGVAPDAMQSFTLTVGAASTPTPTPTPTPSATPTPSPTPTPATPPQALNISTRLNVGTGENVLIGGFIITGNDAKKVIIRGIGPSLEQSGVANFLADPVLELHASDGSLISGNDNWKDTQQTEIEATGIPPTNDLESAIVATLLPGNYTAILSGKNDTTGIGLVEVYDLALTANSQLANISTRGFVLTGDNVMIGGFILGGAATDTNRILVRALGPSLTQAGITDALADPTLELHDGNGTLIQSNDNWKDTQQVEIEATTIPPTNDLESAIVAVLSPGPYTAIVRGKNDTTGVALVEVYHLQ